MSDRAKGNQAGNALTPGEQYFRTMCDAVPVVLWMSDADGNCVYVNSRWIEFTGRTLDYALGAGWLDSVHPKDREDTQTTVMAAFSAHKEYNAEFRLRRADGDYRWVFDTGVPCYTSEGQFAGHIGSYVDVTERRLAEELARKSEISYRSLVRVSPVGIFHTDAEGKCLYVNERWSEITGLTAAETAGDGWVQALHPEDSGRIAKEYEVACTQHQLFKSTYRFLRPDGQITWVYGQAIEEQDAETGEVIGFVGTITDITEQKEIEQQLLQQRAELCHAHRLISVGEIAGVITHELSQPIGAIANYVKGAINHYQDEADANSGLGDTLNQILKLTERSTTIIGSMRALMRKQDSTWQPLDINDLIRETVLLIEMEAARRQVEVTLELAADIRMSWGDRVQLQQLLLNLILNGLEAVEAVAAEKRRLTLRTRSVENAFEIWVSDSGLGFAEELAGSLFEPFVTTKQKGIGLGLSICRTIVEAHGGEISADAGPGAVFRITLPIQRSHHERCPA